MNRIAALLLVGIVTTASGLVSATVLAAQPVDRYRACIDLVRIDAVKGLETARRWQNEAGAMPARRCLAFALVAAERYSEAADQYQALADQTVSLVERAILLGQAGNAWLLAERPELAIEAWTKALAVLPEDTGLLIDRAHGWMESARPEAAVEDLSKAIDLDPNAVDALVYRASAYRQLGALPEARADLARALDAAPNHPEALLERGIVRSLTGDRDGARNDWLLVLAVAPGTVSGDAAQRNLARLGATGG